MEDSEIKIKQEYKIYLSSYVRKGLAAKLIISIIIIFYFMYSDLYLRGNIYAFYTRILPLVLSSVTLVIYFLNKKYTYLGQKIYLLFLVSILLMTLEKCLIHLHDDTLSAVVSSTILAFFLISLELRSGFRLAIVIYFVPTIVFILVLVFFFDVSAKEQITLANIFPMIILGFVINISRAKLRYNVFKANYSLAIEQKKTAELYEEVLVQNNDLNQKNKEITEQKEDIENKTKQLKTSNAAKDRFFSIISHDLRSPFNSMLGFSELLIENFDEYSSEQSKEFIVIMHKTMVNTFNLLENLLIWSHSQSDNLDFNPIEKELYWLSENSVELLQQTAKSKSIALINQIPEDIYLTVDENMFLTVIRNLISNAIKFTPKGGEIKIMARLVTINDLKNIEIVVEDNGVGISEEMQLKLFDISNNISTKGTEKERGTGLGLILCKEFVEKHDGKIWLESERNKGSRFCFTLPVYRS